MSVLSAVHSPETPVQATHTRRRNIRVGRTTVSYTMEAAAQKTPSGRLFLLPGLLGCEVSYVTAQHYLAQTTDLQVVTLTHDRSARQLAQPRRQRSQNAYSVMKVSDREYGFLPKLIIGHSMGGADAASVLRHDLQKGNNLAVRAAGFDSSVGLNGRIPNLREGLGFLREEVLSARGLNREQIGIMLDTFGNYTRNPLLAAAEAVLAATADIRHDMIVIDRHLPTAEFFSQHDYLIPPPMDRPQAIIRTERDIGHLAICLDPDVAYTDTLALLERSM